MVALELSLCVLDEEDMALSTLIEAFDDVRGFRAVAGAP